MPGKKKTPPVIVLRALEKHYGIGDAETTALSGVDLVIEKGEFITIMGPSGCGKTTLLNILGLLDRADDGEYLLDGSSVERLSSARHARIRSEQIGIVFQNFNLIDRLTVIENVALPLTYHGMRRTKRLEAASKILDTFHLQQREYYMPWQLSGGQMQRVAIARALVNQPSIILADEPTGNLDSKSSHIIMQELSDLHKRGNTIIMVTHNPNLTSYASRVIHMLDGRIDRDSKETPFDDRTEPIAVHISHSSEKISMEARRSGILGKSAAKSDEQLKSVVKKTSKPKQPTAGVKKTAKKSTRKKRGVKK
ncbi:MAG TPA: ABC transporter ATP-binding protein [Candidatus Saccharimonadaceae bacterium]|nr:ABC transporter ATP-binding protein [Candidatus Saccharimonadaceae bacterium]